MTDDLFGNILQQPEEEKWKEHWKGMPEFKQDDLQAWKSITVNFESEKDMLDFAKLVNQKITHRTLFIWFPEIEYEDTSKTLCIDGQ